MRRSPPKIGQTATKAAKKGRKSLEMTPQPPQTALKRQHRRSRRRCSDVPIKDICVTDDFLHSLSICPRLLLRCLDSGRASAGGLVMRLLELVG